MNKTCTKCGANKALNRFSKKRLKYSSWCKECHRAYTKQHYNTHKEYYSAKAKKSNKRTREKAGEFIIAYLSKHPCVDCGETDIRVLQFDHIEHNTSDMKISRTKSFGIKRLKREITKCEIRCANCHMKRTGIQFNWFRSVN